MININNTPWEKLTLLDVQALLNEHERETFFFEFKSDDARNETLHKEISAFANTYGGYIFLGVSDDKTISGCKNWDEQRIHNVIYNGISPTPDFDVKSFDSDGRIFYVIKIESGSMPPYVTTGGKIYERVSSASMPINDSSKLSQLYTKHTDSLKKLGRKIGIEKLILHKNSPRNLCGYIDLGFEVQCMDRLKVQDDFFQYDYSEVSQYLKEKHETFSVSMVGSTKVITIGDMRASGEPNPLILPDAAMHNFMVLMADGSAKYRICLFADDKGRVDVTAAMISNLLFTEIYKLIFRGSLSSNFIYAQKYSELTVLKQFTTFINNKNLADGLGMKTEDHIAKYGNTLIVCGNRMPSNDYLLLDKRYMDSLGIQFTVDEIITELFYNSYTFMGVIERSK